MKKYTLRATSDDKAASQPRGKSRWAQDGLTKREYFAAAALQGLLAAEPDYSLSIEHIAVTAVGYADELIRALNRQSADE